MRTIRTEFVFLFLLSGCLALLAVPLKVLFWLPDVQDILAFIPMPERPFWHGHELLVGYSQTVLGGYLLTRPGKTIIRLFIVLWLGARVAIFIPDQTGTYLGTVCNIAVFGMLFSYAGLAFFRAAKRLKSAVPGIIILFLLLAEVAFLIGEISHLPVLQETALRAIIWLLILLLFLMGGRIIAAATSGALQKQNKYRPYMAQGRLESYGLVSLIAAAVCDLIKFPSILPAALSTLAATVIFCRLWKWRVWLVKDAFDLTSLHLGYAMLAIGLIFNTALTIAQEPSGLVGFHNALIGGFAVLSTTVMCRTVLQRLRFSLSLPVTMRVSNVCLLGSAFARMGAFQEVASTELLMVSAILWEMAFFGFTATLIYITWRFQRPK